MDSSDSPSAGKNELPAVSELPLIASNVIRGADVVIGPFCVVGREGDEPVTIGDETILEDHVLVQPGVVIGARCVIEDHCRIGRGSIIAPGSRVRSGVRGVGDTSKRHDVPSPATMTGDAATSPISPHALVASNAMLGADVEIGPFAIVGWEDEQPVTIGARTKISPFALIEPGATIGEDCVIDAYCRISSGAVIGNRTQVLYGAAVFDEARIGEACIIGGNVADRTIIKNCVTYFGEIAHDYREPGDLKDWDIVQTPSPIIEECCVIGQNAVIVGGRTIGRKSYVAAGEIVNFSVPPETFVQRGQRKPMKATRGLVRARSDGDCA